LGGDTEGVRQLRLSGPELSEGLRDGHRVDPAAQHLVQLLTSGRQTENVATIDRCLKWKNDFVFKKVTEGKNLSFNLNYFISFMHSLN
jgi:hypothetical protein